MASNERISEVTIIYTDISGLAVSAAEATFVEITEVDEKDRLIRRVYATLKAGAPMPIDGGPNA